MALNTPPPLQNNVMEKEELCSFALSIATSSSLLMVLKAVIELDIIGIINRSGPEAYLSPAQIAVRLPTKDPGATASMFDRMLRVLANNSILSCSLRALPNEGPIERLYGLAPVCQHHLKDAVLDGDSAFKRAHGMTLFEYLSTDMRFSKVFNDAMSNYSTMTTKKMLENYNGFDGLSTLVDVGGGTGQTLNMIAAKYPTIRGVNFDLPHMIKDAPKYDDHGKVIVCDYILPVAPETSHSTRVASNLDVGMLAYCGGGKERTEQEFEALAKGAGFETLTVLCAY
ncbi:hypothetical protein Cgig2_029638 [Carnegiea gigantea]|uniref:O-methyltransferase C-terminal domain-containing protein n=1 Tax=Carnegiea gigantea TaxID=171969 RepID=A0A9Q1KJ19_9CARY|nr:hypothetical protein Cgig2_029638 [Carnegiea gigantea]